MRRVKDERGATAVIVALLMIPLLGFAAIAVDVGSLYAERRQLQNGADAAALAVAQDCAVGAPACSRAATTAATLGAGNANDGSAASAVTLGSHSVVVKQSTRNKDGSTGLAHVFAPALGIKSSPVSATASARWGVPARGPVILPLAFSYCEYARGFSVRLSISPQNGLVTCTSPDGTHRIPRGLGWLQADASCNARLVSAGPGAAVDASLGLSFPLSCLSVLSRNRGKVVLFPIFDDVTIQGLWVKYSIYGFAAFRITGWRLPFSYSPATGYDPCLVCMQGTFEKFVTVDDAWQYGAAPDLGASVARLTLENK